LRRDGGTAFYNAESLGYQPLRDVIFSTAEKRCGLIYIVNGLSHAVDALASKFISPGDVVLMERPGLQGIGAAFLTRRAKVVEFDVGDLDRITTLIKQHLPKFIFLVPNFQMPTGFCYSDSDKQRLIDLADDVGTYIIEADIFGDFYYDSKPRVTLKSLCDRVIYIKSFSAALTVGLQIGFVDSPLDLTDYFSESSAPSGFVQRIFDFYLRSGKFQANINFMRHEYGKRYRKMIQACETYLSPYASFSVPGGGLGVWVSPCFPVDEEIFEKFLARQVVVSPGKLFSSSKRHIPDFRINFANVPEAQIAEGVGIIASVLAQIR